MDHFTFKNNHAHCEEISVNKIGQEIKTPVFIYSLSTLKRHLQEVKRAFGNYQTLPCYAVKANSNLSILREIFREGFGADVVSGGEMERAIISGANPEEIVFSGVGKTEEEIARAIQVGIFSFNVESIFEVSVIASLAKELGKRARVSIRVNPNIDAKTNPKISTGLYSTKFGIAENDLSEVVSLITGDSQLDMVGISCHLGSQLLDIAPIEQAARRMATIASSLMQGGVNLKFIDMGGGLGIRYVKEKTASLDEYAGVLIKEISKTGLRLVLEPGRVIVGNAGILLTKVLGVKTTPQKTFIVVDAGMNDLMRPTLYGAEHEILPAMKNDHPERVVADIVGPICETTDFLAKNRKMDLPVPGSFLWVRGCGAYGSSMTSNYNTRPRPAEVLVDGEEYRVIRKREDLASLWKDEVV